MIVRIVPLVRQSTVRNFESKMILKLILFSDLKDRVSARLALEETIARKHVQRAPLAKIAFKSAIV